MNNAYALQAQLFNIILDYNSQNLIPRDRKYVASPYFAQLYVLMDLTSILLQYNLSLEGTHIDKVKRILDYIFLTVTAHVVCVKVKNIRPKYLNLKTWMEDPQNVYIGRAEIVFVHTEEGKKRWPYQASIWANPFKVSKEDSTNGKIIAINKYREYIVSKLKTGEIPLHELEKLRGKFLGCWCKPGPCHGDVLVEILQSPPLYEYFC